MKETFCPLHSRQPIKLVEGEDTSVVLCDALHQGVQCGCNLVEPCLLPGPEYHKVFGTRIIGCLHPEAAKLFPALDIPTPDLLAIIAQRNAFMERELP